MTAEVATARIATQPRNDAQSQSEPDDWGERVAHELRGPAGVTLGALDELELGLDGQGDAQRQLIAMARRGVRKVLRTAERLSRKSQLDSGRAVFQFVPVDLGALLKKAKDEAELIEARRGIVVKVESATGVSSVPLDESWTLVAITELITTAIRAARKEVTVSAHMQDDKARVVVSDDGKGLPKPVQSTHGQSADRRDAGLSVTLARGIARALGGDVQIEAAEPSGTRATLLLGRIS